MDGVLSNVVGRIIATLNVRRLGGDLDITKWRVLKASFKRFIVSLCYKERAYILVPILIIMILLALILFGFIVWSALGIEWSRPPLFIAAIPGITGSLLIAWTLYYFRPLILFKSTFYMARWFVLEKLFGVKVILKREGNLITTGPYKYMRHPIYSGGLQILFSLGLLYGFPLISTMLLYLWFEVLTGIEEKYLEKIYGYEYLDYARKTPRYIPKINVNYLLKYFRRLKRDNYRRDI